MRPRKYSRAAGLKLRAEGKSVAEIARALGCYPTYVYRLLGKMDPEQHQTRTTRVGKHKATAGWTNGVAKNKALLCLCKDCIRQCPERAELVKHPRSLAFNGHHFDPVTGKKVARRVA